MQREHFTVLFIISATDLLYDLEQVTTSPVCLSLVLRQTSFTHSTEKKLR